MSKNLPHYTGHRGRLRERFLKSGYDGMADYEVIELLLTLAIPRKDVKEPAKRLIQQFGNLKGNLDAPVEELREVEKIGAVTPVALKIMRGADFSEVRRKDVWSIPLGILREAVINALGHADYSQRARPSASLFSMTASRSRIRASCCRA